MNSRPHYLARSILLPVVLLFIFMFNTSVRADANSADGNPRPVISDELHILNQNQISKIKQINRHLMKKYEGQQIWIISTNKTLAELQDPKFKRYLVNIRKKGPTVSRFSMGNNPFGDYYAKNYQAQAPYQDKVAIRGAVNIILIDPNLLYHVMPIASQSFMDNIYDFQNLFMGLQLDYMDVSAANVMNTVDVLNKSIQKNYYAPFGLRESTFEEVKSALIMLAGFIIFVVWIIDHWNTPLGGGYVRSNEDNYDSGYMDGYYIGLHDHNDENH